MFKKAQEEEDDSDEDSDEYDRNNRSCEEVHSDDLEGDMNLSGDEAEHNVRNQRATRKNERAKYKLGRTRVYRQEVDTNIFKIGFKTLAD